MRCTERPLRCWGNWLLSHVYDRMMLDAAAKPGKDRMMETTYP
ncbi:hypothetical protein Hdeb2414_s0026g00679211 [Helianthus debilis subsp. tardiflorus]